MESSLTKKILTGRLVATVTLIACASCSPTQFQAGEDKDSNQSSEHQPEPQGTAAADETTIVNSTSPANVMGGFLTCSYHPSEAALGCDAFEPAGGRFSGKVLDASANRTDGSTVQLQQSHAGINAQWVFALPRNERANIASISAKGELSGKTYQFNHFGVPQNASSVLAKQQTAYKEEIPLQPTVCKFNGTRYSQTILSESAVNLHPVVERSKNFPYNPIGNFPMSEGVYPLYSGTVVAIEVENASLVLPAFMSPTTGVDGCGGKYIYKPAIPGSFLFFKVVPTCFSESDAAPRVTITYKEFTLGMSSMKCPDPSSPIPFRLNELPADKNSTETP